MGREELAGLIGPERATALWPRYQALAGSMANIGAVELVATVYEKKYDDVVVTRVDQLPPAQQDPGDRDTLSAMVHKLPLYTVRVKRKTEPFKRFEKRWIPAPSDPILSASPSNLYFAFVKPCEY